MARRKSHGETAKAPDCVSAKNQVYLLALSLTFNVARWRNNMQYGGYPFYGSY